MDNNNGGDYTQIQTYIKRLFSAQDTIKSIAQNAKDEKDAFKDTITTSENFLKNYMSNQGIEEFEYNNELLVFKNTEKQNTLNKKSLLVALTSYFGDEENAEECLKHVLESIGTQTVPRLSRKKCKAPTKPKKVDFDRMSAVDKVISNGIKQMEMDEGPPDLAYDSE